MKEGIVMYYFAYGSNINLEQMKYRCPNSHVVGRGNILDYKLVFNFHADIIPCKNDYTPVLIWEIDKMDWLNLDRYEGYPKYYEKKIVRGETESGEIIQGIVYVMAEDRKGFDLPSRDYFRTIKIGYLENDMNLDELWRGVQYTYDRVQEEEYSC